MEDIKRDNGKAKRSRSDQVKQVAFNYLQKRNYPILNYQECDLEEFKLTSYVANEISRPNSILYSCFNNDPNAIDQTFSKFISWLRELLKGKNQHEDLELLIGPLFCHLYIEILRGGQSEKATNFFKNHISVIDRNKCDRIVQELINTFATDGVDLNVLKENFRCHKYVVKLSLESIDALKQFLTNSGHIVLLQVFQNWFTIDFETKEMEEDEEETEPNGYSNNGEDLCNGFTKTNNLTLQKLLDVIEGVKNDLPNLYLVNIGNVKDEVSCGLLHRQKGMMAYSYNNAIVMRSLNTLEQLDNTMAFGEVEMLGHSSRVYAMSVFKTSNHLVSVSQDKTVRLFDLSDYKQKMVYKGHEYPIYCVATSPQHYYFLTGSYDRTAQLWTTERSQSLRVFVGHTQQVNCLSFHPNGLYVITAGSDKAVRMWSIENAEPIRLLTGSKGSVYCVSVNTTGQYLVSGGEDRRLRIWDIASSKQLTEIKTGLQPVTKVTFNDEGNLLATASVDGVVNVWNFSALVKRGSESASVEPIVSISVNPKVLALDHCFETFGCLTAQHGASHRL